MSNDATPAPARLAYSINEVCALLGISRARLYQAMNAGELPTVHVGSRRLIRAAALDAYLDRLEAEQHGGDAA